MYLYRVSKKLRKIMSLFLRTPYICMDFIDNVQTQKTSRGYFMVLDNLC